jgi:acyl-CoA thioesterase-2
MPQDPLDLSRVFDLEPHGPDTFLGESPAYSWGRIYGGLVIAQALWAATQTVHPEHSVHSLHAYFILGGDPKEPVRYEVDRVRNGRSFTTRRVLARQSAGAILTLGCSFQAEELGPETQSPDFPSDVPMPEDCKQEWDAGAQRADVEHPDAKPRAWIWARYPEKLDAEPRLQACALAYLSDLNPMGAVMSTHPDPPRNEGEWDDTMMGVSLDHAMWFHRPVRADDWLLFSFEGQGLIRTRGLATGPVFQPDGTHSATVAQECLLRDKRYRDGSR